MEAAKDASAANNKTELYKKIAAGVLAVVVIYAIYAYWQKLQLEKVTFKADIASLTTLTWKSGEKPKVGATLTADDLDAGTKVVSIAADGVTITIDKDAKKATATGISVKFADPSA